MDFIGATGNGFAGNNWSQRCAKLQSKFTTNKPTTSFFTGRMPFLSPNQQCQSTEGKKAEIESENK